MNALVAYRRMARNNAWANVTLYAAIGHLADDAFGAPRPGFFGSLAGTMNHIHQVDLYYLDALEDGGAGRRVFSDPPLGTAAELSQAQARADARLIRFCDALAPQDLDRGHSTDRETGPVEEQTAALLLHLFQHQIHHRGQAHVQLSHAGIAPPQLDDFHLIHGRVASAERYWA